MGSAGNLPAPVGNFPKDKFRAVQFLTAELAQEAAGALLPNGEYAVWSPHDATEAAATLAQFLQEQTSCA